jgi:alpha-tubulin suppressor-like RCC1 family protein
MSLNFENFARGAQRIATSKTMSIALDRVGVKRVMWALAALVVALFVGGCSAGADSENVSSVTGALCSGLHLTTNPASPQNAGALVTVTAGGVTCDVGETPEYIFYYLNAAGTYTLFRDWATSNTAVWDTTGLPSGTYNVYVVVRPVGGNTSSSAYLDSGYSIGSVCNTTNSFTLSPTSPQPSGTMVSLSATATCTGGTPEFRYGYYAASGSFVYINAGYSTTPVTWNTAGLSGSQTLLVFTRAVGNTSTYESYAYGSYTLGTASTTCSTVGLSASPPAPQSVGTMVTLTGTASPCGSPQYIFYYRAYGSTTWLLLRDYGPAAVTWNTTGLAGGTYELLVGAHNTGNTGGADAYTEITYAIGSSCSAVTASASPTSPQAQGTQVVLAAVATCGSGSAEYQFYYQDASATTRTLIRTWGPATVTWDTSALPASSYTITVFARAVGNSSSYDAYTQFAYALTPPALTQVQTGFGYHSCAILNNGKAECWGQNTSGQLGNGSTTNSSTGVAVSALNGVVAIATGFSHSCAVLSDNTVRCWGDGSLGQLGNGGTASSSTPVTVTGLSDATAISAGMNHTCVLRTGGAVSCWGDDRDGQLGSQAVFPKSTTPVAVAGVSGASAVSAGGFHTCALIGGAVSCWGDNSFGALGNGGTPTQSFTPVSVTGLSGVTILSGGEQSSCAVVGGAVSCWGDNTYGQLGNGTKTQSSVPVSVPGITTAVQVSAGYTMACARLSSGAVNCWGYNNEGELGNGSAAESLTPTPVSNIATASSLSVGGLQSCALSSGGAQCWGFNGFGQLGNGTTTDAHTPVSVQ